jgi:hypothetical protein
VEPERAAPGRHLARKPMAGDVEFDDPHVFLPAGMVPSCGRGLQPMTMVMSIINVSGNKQIKAIASLCGAYDSQITGSR